MVLLYFISVKQSDRLLVLLKEHTDKAGGNGGH